MTQEQTQTDRGGVGVVGRLRHVDIVVGVQVFVFAFLETHGFQSDVGDDFVGIHVGGRAGAALNHVDHELIMEVAADQAGAGLADRRMLGVIEVSELMVCICCRLLDHGQRDYQFRVVRKRHAGEVKVVHRSQGLDAVISVGRYFENTKQVFFDAR